MTTLYKCDSCGRTIDAREWEHDKRGWDRKNGLDYCGTCIELEVVA